MPCYMTGSAEGDAELMASEANAEVTRVTRMLCRICQQAEDAGLLFDPELNEWWQEHKQIDAERLERANDLRKQRKMVSD